MKKIYLFSVALVAFVMTSLGQANTCGSYTVFAQAFTYPNANDPHCQVFLSSNIINLPYTYAALGDENGLPIPQWNNTDPWTEINSATGDALFLYDCVSPGSIQAVVVLIRRTVNNEPPINCSVNIPPAIITPIKLTSFTGRLQNDNAVILDWTSEMEWDSYKYEVQRSADGKYYETIGLLNAAGTSTYSIKYTYNDQLPSAGAYFYRLKQIDFDGTFEYSKVVYVNSKKGAGVITKIFPNPFKGSIQLIGATSSDLTPNNVGVYTISGQRIPYRIIGANSISIDASAPDGIYILKVKDQHFRIVKSRSASTAF